MIRFITKKPVIVGIVIVAALGCLLAVQYGAGHENAALETIQVSRGDIVQKVLATGALFPMHTIRIGGKIQGTIKAVFVDYNSPVQSGQLLALIDRQEYEMDLSRAMAVVAQAQATVAREDIAYGQATSRLKRAEALAKDGAIPQSQYEEAQTAFATAQAQKEAAQAQRDQATIAFRTAAMRLDYTRIISPLQGIVLSRDAEIGQRVQPESSVLFTIASELSTMELRAEVSESDIGKVVSGQEAAFSVDAFPDTVFKGEVRSVRMEPIIDQKSVSYGVIITVQNDDLLLRPNMTATIWIETAKRTNVLVIPAAAITDTIGRKYVTVFDTMAIRKEVRTGLKGHDGLIEILSGLREGDNIIFASKAK
jgi:HlyD family secretion protein